MDNEEQVAEATNEQATQEPEQQPAEQVEDTTDAGTKITDVDALQKELDKVRREAAKYRTEKKELKEYADKYREYEESQKTEFEKVQERNQALEAQLQQLEAAKIVSDITVKYGLSADDHILLGEGSPEVLEARAEKIAELRKAAVVTAPPSDIPKEKLRGGGGVRKEPVDDAYPSHWK